MFKFLNARYRHITGRHNIPYASLPVTRELVAVDSIVIPCTGADFVEEALLSATFAERYASDVSEIVIVSDQLSANCRQKPALLPSRFQNVKKVTAISRSTSVVW